jgi:arginase family enzyme
MTDHQRRQAERFGVEVIDMHDWHAGLRPDVTGHVYLSLDLDGLDPAFAPGVSHPEPGGLTTRDVLDLVRDFADVLMGADIVELNPLRDPAGLTAMVAAKFYKEIVGHMRRRTP